jgi:hypothetical protein
VVSAAEARADLAERVGGPPALGEAMKAEGIAEAELTAFLFDEVRASYYVDKAVVPILAVSEDALREAYRRSAHPFRGKKFEDVRLPIRRWLVTERLRAAEIEFLQGARARIRTTAVPLPVATVATGTTTAEAPVTK